MSKRESFLFILALLRFWIEVRYEKRISFDSPKNNLRLKIDISNERGRVWRRKFERRKEWNPSWGFESWFSFLSLFLSLSPGHLSLEDEPNFGIAKALTSVSESERKRGWCEEEEGEKCFLFSFDHDWTAPAAEKHNFLATDWPLDFFYSSFLSLKFFFFFSLSFALGNLLK